MHSEEDLNTKFIVKKDHPIWYYKKLEPIDIDYVIMNLLKENFVVEINNHKYEITFGINKADEIGFNIKWDEFNNEFISSYNILTKGFKNGNWFVVTDNDTSDKFKIDYNLKLKEYKKEQKIQFNKEILTNFIDTQKDIDKEEKNRLIEYINNYTNEEREFLVKRLFENINK